MSTKSKRRRALRHPDEHELSNDEQFLAGVVMGALLNAITFGALIED
jgi:hypothetical protein